MIQVKWQLWKRKAVNHLNEAFYNAPTECRTVHASTMVHGKSQESGLSAEEPTKPTRYTCSHHHTLNDSNKPQGGPAANAAITTTLANGKSGGAISSVATREHACMEQLHNALNLRCLLFCIAFQSRFTKPPYHEHPRMRLRRSDIDGSKNEGSV